MKNISAKDLPPPTRKPTRRLSLKTAIAAMSRPESQIVKPLMGPLGESCSLPEGKDLEVEVSLLELQADLIIREGLLNEKEMRLLNHEREINEATALLEAHQKILLSTRLPAKKISDETDQIQPAERAAFDALKRELLQQEVSLKEAREMLQERDLFIEECENELVEQSMILTEREAQIEQREEDHEAKKFADKKAAQSQEETT